MSDHITLRRMSVADVDFMLDMAASREAIGEHNWAGEFDRDERASMLIDEIASDQTSQQSGRRIVVLQNEVAIGDVSWRTEQWGPSSKSRCPAIGIALLPRYRGHGYGTEAQLLLVDFLFSTFDVHRVQSDTAVDNVAEQRALESVGFVREGVVRDAEFRNDRYYDHILYSVLRSEWSPRSAPLV